MKNSICTSINTLLFEYVYLYYNNIVDYYINTINDMRNEKDCFLNYNVFDYDHDSEAFC